MGISEHLIENFSETFPSSPNIPPWLLIQDIVRILTQMTSTLDRDYVVTQDVAIHKNAVIEQGVILKGPIIICENCFVAAHAYLRAGVFLKNNVVIGPGCEIKSSIIFSHSAFAHFNFIGDSIIGNNVNFEAGSVTANHFNEKDDNVISVFYDTRIIRTGVGKFGSVIGDGSRIGANAVLSPGTILPKQSIVKRLELVDQLNI
jgi:NDP-sugar pyrophosphorylase family protein